MKCIWQLEGDKVKGFKCEFSPVDMLIVVSGLKYITADIERHPKDRERAQHIYNKIMLSRYEDEPQGDDIIVRSNLYPFRVAEQTEPKPICESCSKNPCKKKKMINDIGHWVSECTEFDRKTDIGTSDTVYSDTAGYVPRVDMTDCSWQKGE